MEAVKLASPALKQVINDLQALRGIADISAVTIAAELGQVSRFGSARELMGYCGAVPSEDSSGKRFRRGGITKTGKAHLRRIVGEAQHRLHKRYMRLGATGKPQGKIITAVARELLGFIWAIGIKAETTITQRAAA